VSTWVDYFISIVETSKNSRIWMLSFYVLETYSDGSELLVRYEITQHSNNANIDGKIDLGEYTLTYDIKGNGTNIKAFSVEMNK